jgi:hypothetical protein
VCLGIFRREWQLDMTWTRPFTPRLARAGIAGVAG